MVIEMKESKIKTNTMVVANPLLIFLFSRFVTGPFIATASTKAKTSSKTTLIIL